MSAEPRSEKEVVNEFQARRARLNDTITKLSEMTAEIAEHDVVIKALEPMDAKRKCFRLIGDVLVERNVGEVLPAVRKHKENLDALVKSLTDTAKQQETDLAEFQAKYKIRIVKQNEEEEEEEQHQQARPAPSQAGPQGVLVGK